MVKNIFTNEDAVWVMHALERATLLTEIINAVPDDGEDASKWLAVVRALKLSYAYARDNPAEHDTPAAKAARRALARMSEEKK